MEERGRKRTVRRLGVVMIVLAVAGGALLWSVLHPTAPGAGGGEHAVEPRRAHAGGAELRPSPQPPLELAPAERQAVESARSAMTLVLTRFPDGAPLANVPLGVDPPRVAGAWLATGPEGRVTLDLSDAPRALLVAAEGFEPAELLLDGRAEQVLELRPLSGLFGFVRLEDGAPAAGARLEAILEQATLHASGRVTRERPQASITTRWQVLGTTTSASNGGYYLACATATLQGPVRVSARSQELAAELLASLPRAADALEDLVLEPARTLEVRVIGENGLPVEGALVESPENPTQGERESLLTDARGVATLIAPALPATVRAGAEGLVQRRLLLDGVEVDPSSAVASCDTRVELVLAPLRSLRARIVDAETGMPLFLVSGRVEFFHHGSRAGSSDLSADGKGEVRLVLERDWSFTGPDEPELARVQVFKRGYAATTLELDLLALPPGPLVIAMQPEPDTASLRGRAMRDGQPVPDLQVAAKVQRRSDGTRPRGWHYERAWTDAEGRFSLRWKRDAEDQVVTVYPHWTRWEEFAYIGPLDLQDALAQEHVLELQPAVLVPALLRGVTREGDYRYYVSVLEGDVAVSSTVNGAPIRCQNDGEARVLLALPSQRRVRVTIGTVVGGSMLTDGSTPAVHDPARPELPLVLDVALLFARLQGRVVGFAEAELDSLRVGFASGSSDRARLVPVRPEGRFELPHAPLGTGKLSLLRTDPSSGRTELLGLFPLVVSEDRHDLVLAADPASLPTARRD